VRLKNLVLICSPFFLLRSSPCLDRQRWHSLWRRRVAVVAKESESQPHRCEQGYIERHQRDLNTRALTRRWWEPNQASDTSTILHRSRRSFAHRCTPRRGEHFKSLSSLCKKTLCDLIFDSKLWKAKKREQRVCLRVNLPQRTWYLC
jgi:hypothetical protein